LAAGQDNGRTHKEWLAALKSNPETLSVEIDWPYEESDAQSAPTRWSDLYGGEVAWVKGDPAEWVEVDVKRVRVERSRQFGGPGWGWSCCTGWNWIAFWTRHRPRGERRFPGR
jgi:hypothetical protein